MEEVNICRNVLADPTTWSKLVYEGDTLVACVTITLGEYGKPETIEGGKRMIDLLMVHPDCWGQGLASGLLDDISEEFKKSTERITLWTEINNSRSRPLYERKGYRATGRTTNHPRNGEHQVEYEKILRTA